MISTKKITYDMNINLNFVTFMSAMISTKKQFDENMDNEITKSLEESFRVDYFRYIE